MTEEQEQDIYMLKYFWDEKGDVTRYTGFEEAMELLKEYKPHIYIIIKNYLEAERAMESAMKELY